MSDMRSEEHTSELQSPCNLVCRLLLEKKKQPYTATLGHLPFANYRTVLSGPDAVMSPLHAGLTPLFLELHFLHLLNCLFFFNDTATTEIYTLSLHDALPICSVSCSLRNLLSSACTRCPRST